MFRFLVGLTMILCSVIGVQAQSQTELADRDTVASTSETDGELILDEIEIHGQVEKPGVIVMPRRVDPEIDQLELNRSFENEVKNGDEALPEAGEALGRVDDVKSIKKAVERKRN